MQSLPWLACLSLALAGCSNPAAQPTQSSTKAHHEHGARVAIHGMVLFGKRTLFLEHIPMFSPPHDQQLILRVAVGKELPSPDFSREVHTVKPTSELSLDKLAAGRVRELVGDIYRGNFESGGEKLHSGVRFAIEGIVLSRALPSDEASVNGEQAYFVIGSADDAYLSHHIRPARAFQQILAVDGKDPLLGGLVPDTARAQQLVVRGDERLRGGRGTTRELWCLVAPDFVEPCR
jgi:hypothetical protein